MKILYFSSECFFWASFKHIRNVLSMTNCFRRKLLLPSFLPISPPSNVITSLSFWAKNYCLVFAAIINAPNSPSYLTILFLYTIQILQTWEKPLLFPWCSRNLHVFYRYVQVNGSCWETLPFFALCSGTSAYLMASCHCEKVILTHSHAKAPPSQNERYFYPVITIAIWKEIDSCTIMDIESNRYTCLQFCKIMGRWSVELNWKSEYLLHATGHSHY